MFEFVGALLKFVVLSPFLFVGLMIAFVFIMFAISLATAMLDFIVYSIKDIFKGKDKENRGDN